MASAQLARMRECSPTRMFSIALMFANNRIFWYVREMPRYVT